MRQIISHIVVFFTVASAFIGCERHSIIPDGELVLIFRDAFLTNAYISNQNVDLDSLNIYEPIFANYGYTTADVHYTIGNFSKRKSARLGDVVELAIDMLEDEGKYYDKEVAILDTVNNVAQRRFTRVIYSDTLIRVARLRDTSRLEFVFSDIHPGEYKVEYSYKIDSTAKNDIVRSKIWFERADSSQLRLHTSTLRRNYDGKYSRAFKADTSTHRLVVDILNFDKKPHNPYITIKDFKIKYIPTVSLALDSLYKNVNVRIFADEFFFLNSKDSLKLSLDSIGISL